MLVVVEAYINLVGVCSSGVLGVSLEAIKAKLEAMLSSLSELNAYPFTF